MRTNRQRVTVLVTLVSCGAMTFGAACNDSKEAQTSTTTTPAQGLVARVVAVGIPGAGPVTAVGRFLPGGPINDNAAFKAYTDPGRVLDPNRVLVGSLSNFGANKAVTEDMPGSILSIDAGTTQVVAVPPDLAKSGTQASAVNGAVQLYSGQTAAFLNSVSLW